MNAKEKRAKAGIQHGLPKENLSAKMQGVSLGKDKKGYFVYTHRARCDFYPTPEKIPASKIKFIESTG